MNAREIGHCKKPVTAFIVKFKIVRHYSSKLNGRICSAQLDICCSISCFILNKESLRGISEKWWKGQFLQLALPWSLSCWHLCCRSLFELGLQPFEVSIKTQGHSNKQVFQDLCSAEEFQSGLSPPYQILSCWKDRAVLEKLWYCWPVTRRRSKVLWFCLGQGFTNTSFCVFPPNA